MAVKIYKNVRIIILVITLILAIVAINPTRPEGVAIRTIIKDSAAEFTGIESPSPNIIPTKRERILSVNNQIINDISEYDEVVKSLPPNQTVRITTNQQTYVLRTRPLIETIILNETELVNKTFTIDNETFTELVLQNKTRDNIVGTEDIGIRVYDAPTSNIRKGLDLQGGTRVLLQPENDTSQEDFEFILDNMKRRLNVFGLTDVIVRSAADLPTYLGGTGKDFIIVEIAGSNEEEVKDLLSKQGKFEGSDRWIRGYIVKTLVKNKKMSISSLSNYNQNQLKKVIKKMKEEEIINVKKNILTIIN